VEVWCGGGNVVIVGQRFVFHYRVLENGENRYSNKKKKREEEDKKGKIPSPPGSAGSFLFILFFSLSKGGFNPLMPGFPSLTIAIRPLH